MSDLYLVTGGAGFIGCHVTRALLERGDRVRVLDNFSTGYRANLEDIVDEVDIVDGDVRSSATCLRAARGVSVILHQAALPSVPRSIDDPGSTHEVNATGTLQVLIAAREAGVKRIVYASSSSVYGPEPKLPREEGDRPNPISPYAVSKLCGEHYCSAFFRSYGLETVALRYFNVFGPRQTWDSPYAAVVPRFIRALTEGRRPQVFGDGEQVRDLTYVDNVVRANLLAAVAPAAPGRVYNVAAGKPTSINSLLTALSKSTGRQLQAEYLPPRVGDVRDSAADLTRARSELGFEPRITLDEGLALTVNWAQGGVADRV